MMSALVGSSTSIDKSGAEAAALICRRTSATADETPSGMETERRAPPELI